MVSRNCTGKLPEQVWTRCVCVCVCVCDKNVNVLGFKKKYNFKEPKNPEKSIFSKSLNGNVIGHWKSLSSLEALSINLYKMSSLSLIYVNDTYNDIYTKYK